jgi:hypothetical protein
MFYHEAPSCPADLQNEMTDIASKKCHGRPDYQSESRPDLNGNQILSDPECGSANQIRQSLLHRRQLFQHGRQQLTHRWMNAHVTLKLGVGRFRVHRIDKRLHHFIRARA